MAITTVATINEFRIGVFRTSEFLKYLLPTHPCVVARLFVGRVAVADLLARIRPRFGRVSGAHKAVTGAFISHRLVSLVQLLHRLRRSWHRRVYAHVVAGIEAVDRRFDLLERRFVNHVVVAGRGAVEDERRFQAGFVGSEPEGLASTPAEAGDRNFAVSSR